MRTFKLALVVLMMQILPGFCSAAQAQTTSGSFGVTILLRNFSDTVTADHRCTQSGQSGERHTLRISCPTTVDVQAIARASASKTGQNYRNNAEPRQPDRPDLMLVAGKPMNSMDPVELTISW